MKLRQWLVVVLLAALAGAAGIGMYLTGTRAPAVTLKTRAAAAAAPDAPLVDQRPVLTARRLASLALTPDEQNLARETIRLGDHEVDLAFAAALQNAKDHPPPMSAEAKDISAQIDRIQPAVIAGQARVKTLTADVTAAGQDPRAEAAQNQLQIVKAQLAVDEDELSEAKEDLARAGGDPSGRIKRLQDEHEAVQKAADAAPAAAPPDVPYASRNLISQVRAWIALGDGVHALAAAQDESQAIAKALRAEHDALEQRSQNDADTREFLREGVAGLTHAPAAKMDDAARANQKAVVSSLEHFSGEQKAMSSLDKRVADAEDLGDNYAAWSAIVQSHQREALHGILRSALFLIVILLAVYTAGRLVDTSFSERSPDQRHLYTIRVALHFSAQVVGAALALFVVFGAPNQTPTILGLAGAGLTVALKDFIMAFLGWFVLMGRNGIRAGDWVEIKGVGGEVVEISLLRTVLLETGNWTDSGHPTGRRVAFMNSYAVEGHYFNFSTSGQWLWDELKILVPPGGDPYGTVERIQKVLASETEANAKVAEQEWLRTTTRYKVKAFSAAPSVQVRPTTSGIEVTARYITRANERHEVRARLYQKVVDIMTGRATG